MLINAIDPEESRIAVVEDGVLQELHVELANREAYLGNIYKGKVVNIEPSIGAAFVAFGGRVNGFLHVSDVLPAYGRPEFRLDDVIEGRARVDVDDGPESMQQALSDDDDDDHDDDAAEAKSGPDSTKSGPKRGDRKPRKAPVAGDASATEVASGEVASTDASSTEVAITEAASNDAAGTDAAGGDLATGESSEGGASDSEAVAGAAEASAESEAQAEGEVPVDDGETHAGDHHDDEDHAEGADGDEPSIEPVDGVQVVEPDPVEDDHEDDHHGGFGHGLDDERPMAMAAADPGDEADGGGDEGASASVEDASAAPAGPVGETRVDASDAGASSDEAGSDEAGSGEAGEGEDGEGAPRRRRSRSRRSRSRKSVDRADGDRPAGDRPEGDRPEGEAAEGGDAEAAPQGEKDVDAEARTGGRKKRSRRSGGRESGAGSAGSGDSGAGAGASGGNRATNDRRVPRSNRPTIDQLLKRGQEVVVQITKEGIGTKGPTLTTYVSLPGRCLVLMPSLPKCGVSRKIEDGRERRRLKRVVKELDETGSGGIGFIVRTAGIDKSLEDVKRDRDYLKKIWEMVAQRLKVTKAPALLYQESDLVLKAMRDQFTPDIADVVVDSEDVYMRIRDFAEKLMPVMADRIKRHSVTTPLFHSFGIEKDVEALYEPQVDLSNGASIVIDQAEALVAIDVNSGKFKAGSHGSDETAYRTNLESITEIVRQLRLRDLGGLIIIDFIDMSLEKHRRNVERKMIESLRGDRARIKVGRISPFGMMEITRQRVGPGLKRTVFMQCPHCKGAGWSRTVQSKALSVLREARALVNLKGYSMLQVFVAPAVSDYLVNYKRRAVLEVEDAVGKTIVFRPEMSYPIDVVHYRFLTGDGQEARIAIPAGLGVKA